MASRKTLQSSRFDDLQDVSSSKDSQDGSQMLDTKRIEDMIKQHKTIVKARRRNVESGIRQAKDEGFAALRRRSEAEKSAYKQDLETAQRPHLVDLKDILEEKRQLQREVDKTNDELERAQMAVTQQLAACIKSRVDALRK